MAMIRRPENFPETVKEVPRQLVISQEELAHALMVSPFASLCGEPKSMLLTRIFPGFPMTYFLHRA